MMLKLNENRKVHVYITTIVIIAVTLAIVYFNGVKFSWGNMIFWTLISFISESLIIVLPNNVGISVGFATTAASIIVIGPYQAAVCSAIAVSCRIVDVGKKKIKHIFNTELYKTAFNFSQVFISTLLSGLAYEAMGGKVGALVIPQALFIIIIYTALNFCILNLLISFITHTKILKVIFFSIKDSLLNSIFIGLIGLLMALVSIKVGNEAVILFFGPLLIARYSLRQNRDLIDTYFETINAFNKALEAKDPYTSGHSQRVQEYSEKLAESMGINGKQLKNIRTAAILHDIGKIGIDDSILRKPGKLTNEEFSIIKRHPGIGSDILKEVDFLGDASKIIRSHHERFDGKGYPDGLKENEISIEASILSIADVYDAMTSDRPYRSALSKEEALVEIRKNSGIQFNKEVAEKFCEIMEDEQV